MELEETSAGWRVRVDDNAGRLRFAREYQAELRGDTLFLAEGRIVPESLAAFRANLLRAPGGSEAAKRAMELSTGCVAWVLSGTPLEMGRLAAMAAADWIGPPPLLTESARARRLRFAREWRAFPTGTGTMGVAARRDGEDGWELWGECDWVALEELAAALGLADREGFY